MSLSKTKSFEDNYRRDSFSDRVCDDLSEVILQFLRIKDKFRFECVSKQFQRTVFQRHYQMNIYQDVTGKPFKRATVKTLESILKKLPNIKSLESYLCLNDSEIDLIIKYCKHLNEFGFYLREISETFGNMFFNKFGPQLISTSFYDLSYNLINSSNNSLDNIRDISFSYYSTPKDINDFYFKPFAPKRVKKLVINFLIQEKQQSLDNYSNYLKTIIESNKYVTHLEVNYESTLRNSFDLKLRAIPQLNQLISLELSANFDINSFIKDLKQLSLNCHKLKSLSLCFNRLVDETLKNSDFMSEVKKFKGLKRFDLTIITYKGNCSQFEEYINNSLKTGLKGLTHLTLYILNDLFNKYILNESLIENIVNYLPNLQKLFIFTKIEATERTPDFVSRLSKLQHLYLEITNKSFCDSFEKKIREKCRKIKRIEFRI